MEDEVLAATAQPFDAASPEASGELGGRGAVDEGHGVGGDADSCDGASANAWVEVAADRFYFWELRHRALFVRLFCGLKPAACWRWQAGLLRVLFRSLQEINAHVDSVQIAVEDPVQPYSFVILGLLSGVVVSDSEVVGDVEEIAFIL